MNNKSTIIIVIIAIIVYYVYYQLNPFIQRILDIQTITISNEDKAKEFSSSFKNTLMLLGDGLDVDFLESENIRDIDCFIAVSENEQTNLLSSMIVKDFGVKQIITHITTTDYYKVLKKMDISIVISKNISAVNEILQYIRTEQENVQISRYEDLEVEAVELKVEPDSSYITKKYSLSDIPGTVTLAAIIRQDDIIIPSSNTQIFAEDELLLFLKPNDIKKVESLFK